MEKGCLGEMVVSRGALKPLSSARGTRFNLRGTRGREGWAGCGQSPDQSSGQSSVQGEGARPWPDWEQARGRDLGRGGLGFRSGKGIARLLTRGLVLLFAAPLRGVDVCFDGRGRGIPRGRNA